MNRRAFQLGGLLAAALALTGCWRSSYEWNQKLTLTVSTPDGEKSGFAVSSCTAKVGSVPLASPGVTAGIGCRGEAVVVEVKPGKFLFAIREEKGNYMAMEVFSHLLPKGRDPYDVASTLANLREVGTVAPASYPMLVTFDDINDPKSVKQVDSSNLNTAFGPGYAVMEMTLEMTDQPMTKGSFDKILSWDHDLKGSIGKGMNLPYDHFLNQINDGSFRWGIDQ